MTGLTTLFLWSFAAATILPLSSEVPLVYAVRRGGGGWLLPVLVATAGNYLGACTTYWLARVAIRRVEPLSRSAVRHERARRLLARFGQSALLLLWVPVVGDAIVAVAAGLGIRFVPSWAWVVAGKLGRYAAVAWLATRL